MNTTGTFLRSAWMAMFILVSSFFLSATPASAKCPLTSSHNDLSLEIKAGTESTFTVIVITNTGTETINVGASITGEDKSLFSVFPTEFSLAAGGKKEVKVKFSLMNSNILRASATLNFTTNGAVCLSIPLTGIKATSGGDNYLKSDPASYIFPASDSGVQKCKDFIVKNMGTTVAYIQGWKLNTESDLYTLTETPSSTIEVAVGETVKLTLCYTPDAAEVEGSKGTIDISYSFEMTPQEWHHHHIAFGAEGDHNSGDKDHITIDPMQHVFHATDSGNQSCKGFIVKNMGRTTVYIPSWMLSTDSKDFSMDASTTDVKELAPGETIEITVCYNSVGNKMKQSGYLIVSYSFTKDPQEYSKIKAWFGTSGETNSGGDGCLAADGTGDWKAGVLLGSSADRKLILVNKTGAKVTINGWTIDGDDASAFATVNVFAPIEIEANSNVEIPFVFKPFEVNGFVKEKYLASITFDISGSAGNGTACKSFTTHLYGYGLKAHDDDDKDSNGKSIAIPISEKKTIGLVNKGIKESYTLLFVNNLDVDVTIQSISMKEGVFYKITETNPSTTPFVVKPDETFTVSISFESSDRLVHKDALVIVADHNLTSYEFDFEGINYTAAGVKNTLPEGVTVNVGPVPSNNDVNVTMTGIRTAEVDVVDLLGNTVAHSSTTNDWKWNGNHANGTYIVRISGVSANGEAFVTSKRIIVSK